MKKFIIGVFAFFLTTQALLANEQDDLQKHFLEKIDKVISIVTDKTLNKELRNTKIVENLTPMFDFELMAKISLGKIWKTLTPSDQKRFVTLYVKRMKHSYSSKIDAYSDEKIEVTQIKQPKKTRIELVTNLVSKTDKLEISYKFWKPKKASPHKDRWLIYDVVILGVSILKTDKVQFKEYLHTKTIEQLMGELAKK